MKTIKGNLVLTEDTIIDDDLTVDGNIVCEGGLWDLNCRNLNCLDLNCGDLNCRNLNCLDLNCWDLNCNDLNCLDLNCWDLNCGDFSFYAVAITYQSFKCKSWKARREKHIIKCLDGEIEIKDDKKYCDNCGAELK